MKGSLVRRVTSALAPIAEGTALAKPSVMVVPKPAPSSLGTNFSKLNQTALYPGLQKEVKRFDGQHSHTHLDQNIEAIKESKPWLLLASSIAGPFLLPVAVTAHPVFWPAYVSSVVASLRLIARGTRNKARKDLRGKTVLLVGGTGDIGREVASELLSMGATVIIASRSNESKVKETRTFLASRNRNLDLGETTEEPASAAPSSSVAPTSRLIFLPLDISYLSGIRQFCRVLRTHIPTGLHMIVNCCGVMYQNEQINKYGDEDQLSTNALGPYLLIESLLPEIKATHGRIVYVSSSAHVTSNEKVVQTYLSHKTGLWSPKDANHSFDGLEQYGFTKLCNVFHAQNLATRAYEKEDFASRNKVARQRGEGSVHDSSSKKGKNVSNEAQFVACAANPGGVITNLYRKMSFANKMKSPILYPLFTLAMRTPKEGSQTILHCCLADDIVNGGYYQNCKHTPKALSAVACSKSERETLLSWVKKRTVAVMERQDQWKPK